MCKRITASPTSTLLQHAKPLGSSAGFVSWARVAVALAVASSGLLHAAADAAMIVTFEQQGSDVVASYTGSIDLTGMSFITVGSASNNAIRPSSGVALFQNGVATKAVNSSAGGNPWTVAPTAFRTSSNLLRADSVSIPAGNAFGFQATGFFIEPSYVSGTTISGSMTFENVTLASMGINAGDGIMNATFSSGDTLTRERRRRPGAHLNCLPGNRRLGRWRGGSRTATPPHALLGWLPAVSATLESDAVQHLSSEGF